jgi:hypothetical protein
MLAPMKAGILGKLAVAIAVLVLPALALGAIGEGRYRGKIINERGSTVTFRVKGPARAVNFRADPVAVLCGFFPDSTLELRTVVVPRMKINGNRIAGVKVYRDRQGEVIGEAAMSGKRVAGGRIRGTVRYSDRRCSGEEKFVARRR